MDTTPTPIVRSLSILFPPFAERVTRATANARAAGYDVYPFETWRPARRQAELYAQGRSAPGKVVTRAQPWDSWHQYALALDIAFGGPGKWNWNGDFVAAGQFFAAEGLRTLAPFEVAHWEWPVTFTTAEALALVQADGVMAVWNAIVSSQATPGGNNG